MNLEKDLKNTSHVFSANASQRCLKTCEYQFLDRSHLKIYLANFLQHPYEAKYIENVTKMKELGFFLVLLRILPVKTVIFFSLLIMVTVFSREVYFTYFAKCKHEVSVADLQLISLFICNINTSFIHNIETHCIVYS